MSERRWSSAALALFLVVALAARWITFGHPFVGFDEQFYLLVGDRMLDGWVPFVDIWDRKPVGLFLIYAGIRVLGGEGIWQYQLVAAVTLAFTAWLAARFARDYASRGAALFTGLAIILWMNLASGEGGQAPIFYNPLMLGAAALILRAIVARRPLRWPGAAAMGLVGLALQIKYTAVFEGFAFGLMLVWAQWRRGEGLATWLAHALLWAGAALLPTIVVGLYYASIGGWDAFAFANFASLSKRGSDAANIVGLRFVLLWAIVVPLLVFAWLGRSERTAPLPLIRLWLVVAAAAVLVFGTWFDHYALPIVPPAALAAAAAWDRSRSVRRWMTATLAVVAALGQFIAWHHGERRGGDGAAERLLALTKDSRNCPWFYDGQPALYLLGRFCLPTRWPFMGHLNQATERNAVGVDTDAEVRRIMSLRPDVVVTREPAFSRENLISRAIVYEGLQRDYVRRALVSTGSRSYAVYRLRPGLVPLPNAVAPAQTSVAQPAPINQPPSTSLGQ